MNKGKTLVYPAKFTLEDDGAYIVDFIDFEGCSTFGDNINYAFEMAKEALGLYLEDFKTFPSPTLDFSNIVLKNNEFISLVDIDIYEYRKKFNSKSIRKNVTIPEWLSKMAEEEDVNFSKLLQDALKQYLDID